MPNAINPFYASRIVRAVPPQPVEAASVTYARLPQAPVTGSPVPHLTSLYHFHRAGEYGDRSYLGNCGGNLIKDLLLFFKPSNVFDPLAARAPAGMSARNWTYLARTSTSVSDRMLTHPQAIRGSGSSTLSGAIRPTGG